MENFLNQESEIWKEIPGIFGYEASSFGRIRSIDRQVIHKNGRAFKIKGKIITPRLHNRGYLRFSNGFKRDFYIHRAICLAFYGEPNFYGRSEVNHKNGIKTDNRVNNLEWVTPKQHRQHSETLESVKNGHKKQGESLSKTWARKRSVAQRKSF